MTNQLGFLCGTVVCAGVLFQLILTLFQGVRGMRQQREFHRLKVAKLREEIDLLRQRQQTLRPDHPTWEGLRKFRVQRKVQESLDCHSIYLVPHDGKPLPSFKPGQYLTFSIRLPDDPKRLIRCYSLSEAPLSDYYRCTVKKVAGSRPDNLLAGKISSYFNDVLREGDILDVKAPRGSFYLDESTNRPLVLLAGGIGITPLLCMLNSIVENGIDRVVHLFVGMSNGAHYPFADHLRDLASKHHQLVLHVSYSDPQPHEVQGRDYDRQGRIDVELLRSKLPSNNFDFYLCGPPAFMHSLVQGLEKWSVPKDSIHTETFGPSTVQSVRKAAAPAAQVGLTTDILNESRSTRKVRCDRLGKVLPWTGEHNSLLEFAEAHGVPIESGCRAGNCGTCLTAVKSGSVEYLETPGDPPEKGTCLPCICVPSTDLVLDA